MEDIIIGLLKPEKVSAFVSSKSVSYRDLSHMDLRYVKDGKFYRAQSFFTTMWVAKTPTGPIISPDGTIIMNTLADVAIIKEYSNMIELKRAPEMQEHHIAEVYNGLDHYASQFALERLGKHKDLLHRVSFTFTPVPQIIVALSQGDAFLGSITITMNGEVNLLTRTSYSVDVIVEELKQKCNSSMYKEIACGY